MKFAIIAAGEGSRLREEGYKVPKGLVEVAGMPMIDRIISICKEFEPESISCIVNEESPELAEHIRSIVNGTELNMVIKSTPGSMHSFYHLKEFLTDERFCLFTVDSIFDSAEFREYIEYSVEHTEYDGVLAVTSYIDDEKPLYVELNGSGEITGFYDQPGDNRNFVTGGIYFFRPKVFKALDRCIDEGLHKLRNFQRMLIDMNFRIKAYKFKKIVDVDHKEDIRKAEAFLNKRNDY